MLHLLLYCIQKNYLIIALVIEFSNMGSIPPMTINLITIHRSPGNTAYWVVVTLKIKIYTKVEKAFIIFRL